LFLLLRGQLFTFLAQFGELLPPLGRFLLVGRKRNIFWGEPENSFSCNALTFVN